MRRPWQQEGDLPHEKCTACGKEHPVAARTSEGGALCQDCWRASALGACTDCGNQRLVQVRSDGVIRCRNCDLHHKRRGSRQHCACCGTFTRRQLEDGTLVCKDCRRTKAELRCSACGARLDPPEGEKPDVRCTTCRPQRTRLPNECEFCGKPMPKSDRRVDGRRACVWCALERGKAGRVPRLSRRQRRT